MTFDFEVFKDYHELLKTPYDYSKLPYEELGTDRNEIALECKRNGDLSIDMVYGDDKEIIIPKLESKKLGRFIRGVYGE